MMMRWSCLILLIPALVAAFQIPSDCVIVPAAAHAPGAGGTLQGSILLRNSIIASADGMACVGTITDGGGNLRWTGSDSSCPGLDGNPLLGPLQDNGGPTSTLALGTGSAAIGLASANCPVRDQRSLVRPNLPQCDSGAYEFGGIPALNCFLPLVTR